MNHIFDWVFAQYEGVATHLIVLELIAVFFGILSVLYSKKNNVLVYPTGIVGTLIFVYLLQVYHLLGDMIINAYYFVMSVYGWYIWTRKIDNTHYTPITTTSKKEKQYILLIFVGTIIFVTAVYSIFGNMESYWNVDDIPSYVDILTTAFFFVGMWLLAKRKIENWIYLIIGNIISIPLYSYKGLVFSALLYLALTIIAFYGYYAWKTILNNNQART
jgi:nicotinamide mononucleotide transporter